MDDYWVLVSDKESSDGAKLKVVLLLVESQLRQVIVRLNRNNHPQAKKAQIELNAWKKQLNEMLEMDDDWNWKPE